MTNDKKDGPKPDQDVVRASNGVVPGEAADDAVFSADDLTTKFNVTMKTLQHYEALSLIKPLRHGAVRVYRKDDHDRIALVSRDRKTASALIEIGYLFERGVDQGAYESFAQGREKCDQLIKALEAQRADIGIILAELRRIHTILTVKWAGRAGGPQI